MNIIFHSKNLMQQCSNTELLEEKYGLRVAYIIRRRLDNLWAAQVLEDMRYVPGNCHGINGNKDDYLALNINGSKQLLFRPVDHPLPRCKDGSLNWNEVTAVEILSVEEIHA